MIGSKTTLGGGIIPITDPTIIAAITLNGNWVGQVFVDPGGILAQLVSGNVYLDTVNYIKYEFDGTTLVRFPVNTVI